LAPGPPAADVEDFGAALASVQLTAEDYERARDAEADMRELLAGAIGDGEDAAGGIKEGEDVVEGFAKGVTLMPHQVRGTQWMASRESGRKYGGILADVSKDTSGIWSEPLRANARSSVLPGHGSRKDGTDVDEDRTGPCYSG
jgi:hypothetical protein